jgi:hypothetical protein
MDDPEDRRKGRGGRVNGPDVDDPAEADPSEAAFDLWLKRSLHQMFDTIAAEPIPPDLLRLIEDDRQRRRG